MPKILVADDSIAVRKVAERLLTNAGLDVALASNGEEAMAWLANERPDLVISDVIMPDKSGYDVCTFVRSHEILSDTPVILISGIVNAEVERQAESCRADGVLKKPFQGSALQDCVRDLLAKRQAQPAEPTAAQPAAAEPTVMRLVVPPPSPSVEVPLTFRPQPAGMPAADDRPPVLEPAMARMADTAPPAAAPPEVPPAAETPAAATPAAPKVYRITEEQLQTFRQATARIKQLETLLAEEQAKSAQLAGQTSTQAGSESRVRELEGLLATERERSARAAEQESKLAQAEARARGLETALAEERARAAQAPQPVQAAGEDEEAVAQLRTQLEQEQARSSYLMRRLEVLEQMESRVRELEESLRQERARPSEPVPPSPSFAQAERRISELEAQLTQEQERAFKLLGRMDEVERAAAQANARLDEMTRRLLDIARLATLPAEPDPGTHKG